MNTNDYLLNKNLTIGEIISRDYRYAKVFAEFGIDFSFNGNKNFDQVLRALNIEKEHLLTQLNEVDKQNSVEPDYGYLSLPSLMNHIVEKHHKYLRELLPQLSNLIESTKEIYSHEYSFLAQLKKEYELFQSSFIQHMNKEEEILFRVIKYISDCMQFKEKPRNRGYKSIQEVVGSYIEEHHAVGVSIRRFRELTNNYDLPEKTSTNFALTYQKLEELENNTHKHIHLENNILFPKAIRVEESIKSKIH